MSREFLSDAVLSELLALRQRVDNLCDGLCASPLNASGVVRALLSLRLECMGRAKRLAFSLANGAFPPFYAGVYFGENAIAEPTAVSELDDLSLLLELLLGDGRALVAFGELFPAIREEFYAWAILQLGSCVFELPPSFSVDFVPESAIREMVPFLASATANLLKNARDVDFWAEERSLQLGAAMGALDGVRGWVKRNFYKFVANRFYARNSDFSVFSASPGTAYFPEQVEEATEFVAELLICIRKALEELPDVLAQAIAFIEAVAISYFRNRLVTEQPTAESNDIEVFSTCEARNLSVSLVLTALSTWLRAPQQAGILSAEQLETRHGAVLARNIGFAANVVFYEFLAPQRVAHEGIAVVLQNLKSKGVITQLSIKLPELNDLDVFEPFGYGRRSFATGIHVVPFVAMWSALECLVMHTEAFEREMRAVDSFLVDRVTALRYNDAVCALDIFEPITKSLLAQLTGIDMVALQNKLKTSAKHGCTVLIAVDNAISHDMARKCKDLQAKPPDDDFEALSHFVAECHHIRDGIIGFEESFEREILNLDEDYIEELADAQHTLASLELDADRLMTDIARFEAPNELEKHLAQAFYACEARLLLEDDFDCEKDEDDAESIETSGKRNEDFEAEAQTDDESGTFESEDMAHEYTLAQLAGEDIWRYSDASIDVDSKGLLQRMYGELRVNYRVFPQTLVELFK